MKKLIIVLVISFIIINTVAYFVLSKYSLFNYILVSFSIFSTFSMVYILSNIKNADAYRISLSFLYCFLGLVKIFISIFAKQTIVDNFYILWILSIISIEIILLFLVGYVNKHVK
jgi:hypothetical protein